jgi:hypothetical protein
MEGVCTGETALLLPHPCGTKIQAQVNTNTLKSVIIQKEREGTQYTKEYTGVGKKSVNM